MQQPQRARAKRCADERVGGAIVVDVAGVGSPIHTQLSTTSDCVSEIVFALFPLYAFIGTGVVWRPTREWGLLGSIEPLAFGCDYARG